MRIACAAAAVVVAGATRSASTDNQGTEGAGLTRRILSDERGKVSQCQREQTSCEHRHNVGRTHIQETTVLST